VPFESPPPADRPLAEGDTLRVGSLSFDVLHLPGHAPGHVAFHGYGLLFGGDVLFAGSIGRTDLPGANPAHLEQSLARLAELQPDTIVYPGHGTATTIGQELQANPFLNGIARIPRRR
jgi:glyoxylase-like metal-dependent hydrolase (beta-lactamase superfamily II)